MTGVTTFLALTYVGLIAIVMSYAAMHVEFAEHVRSDEAEVAALERTYFASVGAMTTTNYAALGYGAPVRKTYVPESPGTALNR